MGCVRECLGLEPAGVVGNGIAPTRRLEGQVDWQRGCEGNISTRGFFKSTKEFTNLTQKVTVDGRSTLLRKAFVADKPIRRAQVYVTGLGYYELSCNGQRVGDRVLAPAKSNYRKWVLYDTYDLTAQLRTGTNVLGVMLGNGWFNPYKKWWEPYRMQWFGAKRALLQLHLEYADGSSQVIGSDDSWKTAPGPVLASCVFDGEEYDATKELPGWDLPGATDSGWKPANVVEPPGGVLVSHLMPPIKVIEHIKPVARDESQAGDVCVRSGSELRGLGAVDRRRAAGQAHHPALRGRSSARRQH